MTTEELIKEIKDINVLNYPNRIKKIIDKDIPTSEKEKVFTFLYEYQFINEIFPTSMRDETVYKITLKSLGWCI